MPRLVSITTPKSPAGSGPKKELNTPGNVETAGSLTAESLSSAARKPPWLSSTAAITATMPKIMIIP